MIFVLKYFKLICGSYNRNISQGGYTTRVSTILLSDFVRDHVLNRVRSKRETESKEKPRVVVKIDCESCEVEIVFDLITTGMLTKINFAIVEYHPLGVTHQVQEITYRTKMFLCD